MNILIPFRPQPGERCRQILSFEVASATEWGSPAAAFRPTCYVQFSAADMERATEAYEAYVHEVRADPHSRSVEAYRARRMVRGREVGVPWAEGFVLCRQIEELSK